MRQLQHIALLLLLSSITILSCRKDSFEVSDLEDLPSLFDRIVKEQNLAGLAAILTKDDKVLWRGNYGYADTDQEVPVSDNTVFMVASVSKAVTAIAALQLVENGQLDLDRDIQAHLPFTITNPEFPDDSITARQLLRHQSGIADGGNYDVYTYGGDSPISLGSFLNDFFTPSGAYYDAQQNFTGWRPGSNHSYSNVGMALMGYVIERISGQPFNEYCRDSIFTPLGMTSAGWFLSEIDLAQKAIPYDTRGDAYDHYTFADYPNGQLMLTASDLSRFLRAIVMQGTLDGVQILKPVTVELLMNLDGWNDPNGVDVDFTLGWFYQSYKDTRIFGHDGGEQGVSSEMFYAPFANHAGLGVILISNTEDAELRDAVYQMIVAGSKE